MKSRILILVLLVSLALSGCRSVSRRPPSIWPEISPGVNLYYVPKKMASAEEAVGTIKNLQRNFVEWSAGVAFSYLDVDNFGMRARWDWTEKRRRTVAVPTYGAVFAGWNYYPTFSTTFATQTFVQPKSDMFIIAFNEVSGLILHHLPASPMAFKWGLTVSLPQKAVYLRVADESSLYKLADSIATLAIERGVKFDKFWFGCMVAPLTIEQSQRMNLDAGTGILVVGVAKNSSAEKAGIRFLDIVLEFDKRPCNQPKDLGEAVKAAYSAGKRSVEIRLMRLEKVSRQVQNPRSKKLTVELVDEKTEKVLQAPLIY